MLVQKDVIAVIKQIPDHCVYGVFDHINKTVYINYAGNFTSKIKEVSQYGEEIQILSVVGDRLYKLIHSEFYALKYINKGYKIINRSVPFIKLKPVLRISNSLDKVTLYLTSARREKIIVGIFSSVAEAQLYKQQYY